MKRVTAISPYSEAVDAAAHCFFAEGGIETIDGAHLGSALPSWYPSRRSTCAWEPQSNGLMTRLSQCKTARR